MRSVNQLGWLQPSWFSRVYEIIADESLTAVLRFQNWGRTCDATTADGMWRFATKGFIGRTLTISSIPNGESLGTFVWRFRGGLLRLTDGDVYEWKSVSFWSGTRAFLSPSGFSMVTFQPKALAFKFRGSVQIQREYQTDPHLPLLIALGVYLTVVERRRRRA